MNYAGDDKEDPPEWGSSQDTHQSLLYTLAFVPLFYTSSREDQKSGGKIILNQFAI